MKKIIFYLFFLFGFLFPEIIFTAEKSLAEINVKNFCKGTILSSFTNVSTSLTLYSGHGSRFPDVPFRAVLWSASDYWDPTDAFIAGKAEIIEVQARSGDTFSTVVRGVESTTAISSQATKVYQVIVPTTASYLENVNQRVVNVKAYGAKGDGSTDDQSAIQTATNLLSDDGGTLYFPPGVYYLESEVSFSTLTSGRIHVIGAGVNASQIFINADSTIGFDFDFTGSSSNDITIRDLTIRHSTNPDYSGPALRFIKAYNVLIENVSISNLGTLIYIDGGGDFRISHCTLNFGDNNAANSIAIDLHSPPRVWINHSYFLCEGTNPDSIVAVKVSGSSYTNRQFMMTSCSIEGLWKYGIQITSTADLEHFLVSNNVFKSLNDSNTIKSFIYSESSCNVDSAVIIGNSVERNTSSNSGTVGIDINSTSAFDNVSIVGNQVFGFATSYDTAGINTYNVLDIDGTFYFNGGLTAIGDLVATGGFRYCIDDFYQNDIAASQSGVAISRLSPPEAVANSFIAMRPGSITGVGAYISAASTGGTLTVEVTINGVGAGLTAVITNTEQYEFETQSKDADTFSEGDLIRVEVTTDGSWTQVTEDLRAIVELEF